MSDLFETVKKNLRSVLLSSKQGVLARRLQKDYKELTGEFIPHQKLSFSSLEEFITSLKDVCRTGYNKENELTYYALADSSTLHIKQLISKQKNIKKKPKFSSFKRNHFAHRPVKPHTPIRMNAAPRFRAQYTTSPAQNKQFHGVKPPPQLSNVMKFSNPLNTIQTTKKATKPPSQPTYSKSTNAMQIVQRPPSEQSVVKSNFIKLLKSNPSGIHASSMPALYKETFKQKLPRNIIPDILAGSMTGYADVNKINLGSETKAILFPITEGQKLSSIKHSGAMQQVHNVTIKSHSVLVPNKNYKVAITHIESCDLIFVQLLEDATAIKEMHTLIKSVHGCGKRNNNLIKPGKYVSTDCFLRAKVLQVKEQRAEVYNLDVGTIHEIEVESLRLLNQEMANYPPFAIRCSMDRLNKSGSWSQDAVKFFLKLTSIGMQVIMKVVDVFTPVSAESQLSSHEYSVIFYTEKPNRNLNSRVIDDEQSLTVARSAQYINPMRFQPTCSATFPLGEYCDLFILNATCTTEVEVCIIDQQYSDKLCQLENAMFAFYNRPENKGKQEIPQPPPLNCIYAVLQEETCVRGRLMSINGTEGEVYLVDNGDIEIVDLTCLQPLKFAYSQFPTQVVSVMLAGLESPALATHSAILQHLNDRVVNTTCVARVVGRFPDADGENEQIVVELVDTSGSDGILINEVCRNLIYESKYYSVVPLPNQTIPVIVRHVDLPSGEIYLNIPGENLDALNKAMREICESINSRRCLVSAIETSVYVGKPCIACISGVFYRARVEEITDKKPRDIKVYMMDIGRTENLSLGSLFKLSSVSLLSIPPQAIACKLSTNLSESNDASGDFMSVKLSDAANKMQTNRVVARFDDIETSDANAFHSVSFWLVGSSGTRSQVIRDQEIPSTVEKIEHSFITASDTRSRTSSLSTIATISTYRSGSIINSTSDIQSSEVSSTSNESICDSSKMNSFSYKSPSPIPAKDINDNPDIKSVSSASAHSNTSQCNISSESPHKSEIQTGTLIPVKVERVTSPFHFIVVHLQDLPKRETLRKAMTEFYQSVPAHANIQADLIVTGAVYAAAYEDEIGIAWHRVKVQSCVNGFISVYFLDYGVCDFIEDVNSFYSLEKEFAILPPLSLTAKLAGIKPLHGYTQWGEDVSDRFGNLVTDRSLYAHVLKVQLEVNEAIPDRRIFEICLCDTKSAVDVWINDVLVDIWNCAEYVA